MSRGARLALLAAMLFLAGGGCAGALQEAPAPAGGAAGAAADAAKGEEAAGLVLDIELRRSAELVGSRGELRVFGSDLRLEYRARGARGPGLDAGDVNLDDVRLLRQPTGSGERAGISYRADRDAINQVPRIAADGWAIVSNSGTPAVPIAAVRVKLAPYPQVLSPGFGQPVSRTDGFAVMLAAPRADQWLRVSLTEVGDPVMAADIGGGRFEFRREMLGGVTGGQGRLVIEAETSCADCPGVGGLRTRWFSHTRLEIPITVF